MKIEFSDKQKEYLIEANSRWNFKTGATRSGKTRLDQIAVIPKRIRAVKGLDGLIVFIGNTKTTLQRNLIEPMQDFWGRGLISDIGSNNTAFIFGEKVHCLGADKVNQVKRLQGSSIKYCYGDEVATWSPDVFTILKSRLDHAYSKFDGTCNPEHPKHWLKQFLDSAGDVDIFHQKYQLDDNPFLDAEVKQSIKNEYKGTVFYKRYVLGDWAVAEGLIYREIADNAGRFLIDKKELPKKFERVNIGVDFGKNLSDTAFVVTGIANNTIYVLLADSLPMSGKTYNQLENDFYDFYLRYKNFYDYKIDMIFCDSAEPTYINSFRKRFPDLQFRGSVKHEILDRIRATNILIGSERIKFVKGRCDVLLDGLREAVWDETKPEDIRLDDGTSNIDILDGFEYSWEYYLNALIRR